MGEASCGRIATSFDSTARGTSARGTQAAEAQEPAPSRGMSSYDGSAFNQAVRSLVKSAIGALAILSVTSLGSATSAAQSSETQMQSVFVLSGNCSGLDSPDHLTGACGGRLLHMIYRNTRESFAFMVGDSELISFSGHVVASSPAATRLSIDHVTVAAGPEAKANDHPAAGSCVLTSPQHTHFEIECAARTPEGSYRGAFISDGKRAMRQDF